MKLKSVFLAGCMTLALPSFVASGLSAARAWTAWQDALVVARRARAAGEIMNASTQLMMMRGALQEATRAGELDYKPLEEIASAADAALRQTRLALLSAGLPTEAVDQVQAGFAALQHRAQDPIQRRAILRAPVESINRLVDTLNDEALGVERRITLASPPVGMFVGLARIAHEMRSTAGKRGALLNLWLGGQDLALGEREEILILTGRLAGAWDRLQQGIHASDLTSPVATAMAAARGHFFGQDEPWYRELVKAAADGGDRPMSFEAFRPWSRAALADLPPVRIALMAQAEAQGELAVGKARHELLVAVGAALTSLGLVTAVMLGMAYGVVPLVRRVRTTMAALAANDLTVTIPERSRLYEIGVMLHAVRVFRDNLINLHRREADLAWINQHFDAALANMSQGLCMFDPEGRLVVANQRFVEIFGLPVAAVAPGATPGPHYTQILAHAVECGAIAQMDADWLLGRRTVLAEAAMPSANVWELVDGRAFATHYRPTDGGSWLVTFEDITEQRRTEARITHMAHHDALTGLPNRVLFRQRLGEALARARRGESFALLCLDLDHFKAVNDTLGHPVGDALLRMVTERLGATLREIDTVARLGGDEFAILQASMDQPRDATALARRLVETLGAPYQVESHQIVIGASVGIAIACNDGDDPDMLLKNADLALYRAKADGRAAWRFFEPEMDARMQARRLLELDLRRALVAGEFELYYQPLVDLRTRRPTGFEALLRWQHPERGLISPAEFVPVAEEIGLIGPLGEWVLRRACAEAMHWPGTAKVAVNLSAAQFRTGTALATVVADALATSGLPPERLELEVTEGIMLQDTEETLATLHQIRALGVAISMDEFGTGYSSLSYLRRFPFTKVKIDQSFVRDINKNGGDSAAIVRAVVGLCGSLGMSTTAEGVETEEQLDRLAAEGCVEVQGYLFSRPVPPTKVPSLLAGELISTIPTSA